MDKTRRPSVIRRVLALTIDFSILALIGFLSGFVLEDFYLSLAGYGTIAGSAIVIVYFTVLQSKIGKGQTIGKHLLKMQVLSLGEQYLTIGKSLLRSFILYFPLMNIGLLSSGSGFLIILTTLLFIVFAFGYFVLVNKSRRGLHDILVSSIVLNQNVTDFQMVESNDTRKEKWVPIVVLGICVIAVSAYFTFAETGVAPFLDVKQTVEKNEHVIKVINLSTSENTVNITVRIDAGLATIDKQSPHFTQIKKIVRKEFPDVKQVTINLYTGYNIGLESKTIGTTKTLTQ